MRTNGLHSSTFKINAILSFVALKNQMTYRVVTFRLYNLDLVYQTHVHVHSLPGPNSNITNDNYAWKSEFSWSVQQMSNEHQNIN